MTRVQDAASSHTGAHMPGAHMPARAELARDFLVAPLASDADVSGGHTTVIRVGDDASPATPVPCVVAIGAFGVISACFPARVVMQLSVGLLPLPSRSTPIRMRWWVSVPHSSS